MIVGCTVPLLLIFLASALGLGSGASMLIFVVAMFACHLLMPMHNHGAHNHPDQHSQSTKTENHDPHL